MNLWGFLDDHANETPTKVLLRIQERTQTYEQFLASAETASRALHALGARKGDAICMMLENSQDYLHLWFGASRIGAVTVPINVHLKGEGLSYIIRHCGAKILLIEQDFMPRLQVVRDSLPELETVVVRGEDAAGTTSTWSSLMSADHPTVASVSVDPSEVAAVLYTSGTTGPPKGVMLSHYAYLNSARYFAEHMVAATATDVLFTSLPLFHINAQAHTALPAIHLNATMAFGGRFSASGFWNEIRMYEATIFNSLGAMIPILCKQPPGSGDREHTARLTACAATPKDTWLEFEHRFGVQIVEGYGLTETAGFCISNPLGAGRLGSMGKPMGFVDVRIVGESDEPVEPAVAGEIAIRGTETHVLMEGYYDMPEETARTMRGGWFHSGDIGRSDADGYLYFVDRLKQYIRRRGENISSWEVEAVVNSHPLVLESAAVGVPSELGEEEVMICVVLKDGAVLEPLELVQWCEGRVAYFMVPRYVQYRDELPKTPTERVEKYKLKEGGTAGAWDREAAGYKVSRS
ncbi:MAG: AMP-binding protein [Actinobacteria bacterium]|nr:AMP-binding protein [Actinomycetota bacterium]